MLAIVGGTGLYELAGLEIESHLAAGKPLGHGRGRSVRPELVGRRRVDHLPVALTVADDGDYRQRQESDSATAQTRSTSSPKPSTIRS